VPFVNLYLIDSECKHAILSTATGLSTHAGFLCPEVVTLSHNTHSRYTYTSRTRSTSVHARSGP
jgi:hypothetical protein